MMHSLREALSRWRQPRASESAFRFAKVADVCSKYRGDPATKIPDDADHRVKRVLRLADDGRLPECSQLDLSVALLNLADDRRLSPYSQAGRAVLAEAKRRVDRRALKSLFNCFLTTFDARSELTLDLRNHLARYASLLGTRIARFAQLNRVLDDGYGIEATARRIIGSADLSEAVRESGIIGTVASSRYAWRLKEEAVISALAAFDGPERLTKALTWLELDSSDRWGADRSAAYEWLLRPFVTGTAEAGVQRAITDFLLRRFGDPRVEAWPSLGGQNSAARANAYQGVMRKWLALDQLDLFIKIIERTAVERMFRARREFWLPYFKSGLVSDVTLIAASEADREARKVNERTEHGLTWSTLSGAQSNHSVLLLRLDRLVIAEWSHDGKMRFWQDQDEQAPRFHLDHYHRSALTKGSLSIPGMSRGHDGITHHPDGTWQRRAAQTIEHFTGVRP